MANIDLPNIGDKLEIYDCSRNSSRIYISQLFDIINDETLLISGPIHNKMLVPFYENNLIEVVYYKKNKGKFSFEAKILKVIKKGMYRIKVKRTTKIRKIQQRNYYRLSCRIPITKIHNINEDSLDKAIREECIVDDISGGGIGIFCNFPHDNGETVDIQIDFQGLNLNITGKIIRITDSKNRDYKFNIGVKFEDLDDNDRDKIISFIFKEQRKLRKKGLI